MNIILSGDHKVQSPYIYLQTVGSDGSDNSAPGIHLRWDLLRLAVFAILGVLGTSMSDYAAPAAWLLAYSLFNISYLLVVNRAGSKSAVVPSTST